MAAEMNVLMLGGARRVAFGELLRESGSCMGVEVKILSYELTADVPIASIGEVIIGRKWSDADVVDDIVGIARSRGVGMILPFVDAAIEIASRCRPLLPDVFIPVSDPDVCRTMYDKVAAAQAFVGAGIPVPATFNSAAPLFPVIAKPRLGSASKGIIVCRSEEELAQIENTGDYLLQEYIADREEYTADCYVAATGEMLVCVPRLRIEVAGGEVTRTQTRRIQAIIDMCRTAIARLRLRGPVTLQFIRDKATCRYLLMEVNPRLGGGVVCSIHAGAPIAGYLLREALGMPVAPVADWKENALMARYMKEVMFFK